MNKRITIDKIDVLCGTVPVNLHFSYGSKTELRFIMIGIHSGNLCGWGEQLLVDEEKIERSKFTAQKLLGKDASLLDDLCLEKQLGQPELNFESFSIALHDLVAKARSIPLYKLWGIPSRTTIPMMPCIFPENDKVASEKAREYSDAGFTNLKMKLMGDVDQDIKNIRAVKRESPTCTLQGDVNGGYQFNDLVNGLLVELRRSGLDIIEDPCNGEPNEYKKLCLPDGPKIMIDKIARNDALLKETLKIKGCEMVNFHPCQQGTLSHLMKRASWCAEKGCMHVIGGTGHIGVGSAAYRHLSAVVAGSLPCGATEGSLDHGEPILIDQPVYRNGFVELGNNSGHGANVDINKLTPYLNTWDKIG